MVLYEITLVPLTEELRYADPTLLPSSYADDSVIYGLERQCAAQLKLLMDRGYFPDLSKSLFISDNLEDKEAMRWDFDRVGLIFNRVGGSRYLGAYLGLMEDLEAWVQPKVDAELEEWDHRVRTLDKIAKQCTQFEYAVLGCRFISSGST